jgi:hypothetical protein
MKMKSLLMRAMLATAVVGGMALSAGGAHAVKPIVCPDGTVIGDVGKPRPCPKFKTNGTGQQRAQAPKPTDSAKKWRDYINEGYKPKPRPKP